MNRLQTSGFYASIERIGGFLLANLLSACLLMSLLGAPLGLVSLFAFMNDLAWGRSPEFFGVYFGAMRRHWRAALGLGLLDCAGFALIAINLSIFPLMRLQDYLTILSLALTVSFGAVLLLTNIYAWVLLPLLGLPLRATLKLSLLLTFSRPLHSLLLAVAALLPLLISLALPVAFLLIFSLSLSAYIAARGVAWALRRHFPREQLAALLPEQRA